MFNENQFQDGFLDLFQLPIPQPSRAQKTFFDIGSFGHRENIISNFYAYYLDKDEAHGLGDVFIRTLLKLINERITFSNEWSDWDVSREVMVEAGKIDIWIEELEEKQKVILIENKIYHELTNNLKGYLDCVSVDFKTDKIGVLLTVNPLKPNVQGFINITHSEWIEAIKSLIKSQEIEQTEKQKFIFDDFCRNFKSHFKHSKAMMERHLFFLKHRRKIKQLTDLELEYKKDFLSAIDNVIKEYDFTVKKKSKISSSQCYIQIEISERPRIWLKFKINEDPGENPISAFLSFNNTYYARKAKPILKRKALFNKFEPNNIQKATMEMNENPSEDLLIAFKNYNVSDLRKESLEVFIASSLEEDWIPFREATAKLYQKIMGK